MLQIGRRLHVHIRMQPDVSVNCTRKVTAVRILQSTRKLTVMKAMSVNQTVNVIAVMTLAPVPF